jgi:hypothetical protein
MHADSMFWVTSCSIIFVTGRAVAGLGRMSHNLGDGLLANSFNP